MPKVFSQIITSASHCERRTYSRSERLSDLPMEFGSEILAGIVWRVAHDELFTKRTNHPMLDRHGLFPPPPIGHVRGKPFVFNHAKNTLVQGLCFQRSTRKDFALANHPIPLERSRRIFLQAPFFKYLRKHIFRCA